MLLRLPEYSIGIGDRFAHQGAAQLQALARARQQGVAIAPVWNKSHREHTIVGSSPVNVRVEADRAVRACAWTDPYFVDADHVGLQNVDTFISSSDFFTLDVADFIGQGAGREQLAQFVRRHTKYVGRLHLPSVEQELEITEETLLAAAGKFLLAVQEAGRIYRRIAQIKGSDAFVTEVSMDETAEPQTPVELFFILAALADERIPAQTIAPKFIGRFNKGVDYVGDVGRFAEQFEQDLAVIALARREFGLPENLKLSVHSGSDKFSLYRPIHAALAKFQAGLHLKTAGTTWLEELLGLAMAGGEGLQIAKTVYRTALARFDELRAPYATVVDIDRRRLPSPETVDAWDQSQFVAALRHDPSCPDYNPHLRQLLHVGYKVAAEMGPRFTGALERHADVVGRCVTENLYERHIRPLFLA